MLSINRIAGAVAALVLWIAAAHANERDHKVWYVVFGGFSSWGWSYGPLDDYTDCERKLGELTAATDKLDAVFQCASTTEFPVNGSKPGVK